MTTRNRTVASFRNGLVSVTVTDDDVTGAVTGVSVSNPSAWPLQLGPVTSSGAVVTVNPNTTRAIAISVAQSILTDFRVSSSRRDGIFCAIGYPSS